VGGKHENYAWSILIACITNSKFKKGGISEERNLFGQVLHTTERSELKNQYMHAEKPDVEITNVNSCEV